MIDAMRISAFCPQKMRKKYFQMKTLECGLMVSDYALGRAGGDTKINFLFVGVMFIFVAVYCD
jgi:hypothetical protein